MNIVRTEFNSISFVWLRTCNWWTDTHRIKVLP